MNRERLRWVIVAAVAVAAFVWGPAQASAQEDTTTTTEASTTTTTEAVTTTTTESPTTTTTVPESPVPETPAPSSDELGSREALQWLACVLAFAAGHMVSR